MGLWSDLGIAEKRWNSMCLCRCAGGSSVRSTMELQPLPPPLALGLLNRPFLAPALSVGAAAAASNTPVSSLASFHDQSRTVCHLERW